MMTIVQVLLGEHGAMYPLLDRIENTASFVDLYGLKIQASLLQATLISHADIEDALLLPVIQQYLPRPVPAADGSVAPRDHEIIGEGLAQVLRAVDLTEARRLLLDTLAKTRKHFRKEETVIFGVVRRELSDELQEKLGAEWARIRGVPVSGF